LLSQIISQKSLVSNFSLFIKKGKPAFLYPYLIVEPQVYVAVERLFNNDKLTTEDFAFLPKKVTLKQIRESKNE